MEKPGIYIGHPNYIPKLSHPCISCIIVKGYRLARHPNVSTEKLDPVNCFHIDFSFFKEVSFKNFTSSINIIDATTSHLFGYTTRSKCPPLQIIQTLIYFSCHHGYKRSIFQVYEGGKFFVSADFLQLCI